MHEMIAKSKQAQLDEARKQQEMRLAQEVALAPPPPMYFSSPPLSVRLECDQIVMNQECDMLAPSMGECGDAAGVPASAPAASIAPVILPSGGKSAAAAAPPLIPSQPQAQPAAKVPEKRTDQSAPQTPSPTAADSAPTAALVSVDYTKIPKELEKKFEALDEDAALRPTIIKPSDMWTKRFQKTLLSAAESSSLGADEQGKERQKCFDLLDALTKSGALTMDAASLHVVIASTHCFDKTLMNTLIQDNVNPIEKVERSSLIVASTIHHTSPAALIAPEQLERVSTYSPMLIANTSGDDEADE